MWCSAADTRLKLLDSVVSGASFLTEGVFEIDIVPSFICASTVYAV